MPMSDSGQSEQNGEKLGTVHRCEVVLGGALRVIDPLDHVDLRQACTRQLGDAPVPPGRRRSQLLSPRRISGATHERTYAEDH